MYRNFPRFQERSNVATERKRGNVMGCRPLPAQEARVLRDAK